MTPADIRRRREALGWTQQRLASEAGVAVGTIHQIEAGRTTPHRATVAAIEAALRRGEGER